MDDEAVLALLLWSKRRKTTGKRDFRRKRRWWVHPILQRRDEQGEFHRLVQELRLEREDFFATYFRMSVQEFGALVSLIGPEIAKQVTSFRRPISPEERIAVTLRFLATGDSYTTIANSYRLGISTVSCIVPETCNAIWNTMHEEYIKCPCTHSEWEAVAEKYKIRWQFPHCMGAIDGKHIVMKAPPNSSSLYFNYKKTHSLVLLAVVDACYQFLAVDVGAYGRHSDSGMFSSSRFGRRLENGTLGIPGPKPLVMGGADMPFVFVADEAFPLKENVMRPFAGDRLTPGRRVFNYRLSRARRMVESTFGILANQWRVFHRAIPLHPQRIDSVILATCCLHNYLRRNKNDVAFDLEASASPIAPMLRNMHRVGGRFTQSAAAVRDAYVEYFAGEGAVPWQASHS